MNNADLSLEFLKKCQECRENGVPNDMAILAALHDIADYKDKEWTEKLQETKKLEEICERYTKAYGCNVDKELLLATTKEMLSKISLNFDKEE